MHFHIRIAVAHRVQQEAPGDATRQIDVGEIERPLHQRPSTGAGALPLKSVTMMPALIPETAGPWDRENSEKTAKGLVQI